MKQVRKPAFADIKQCLRGMSYANRVIILFLTLFASFVDVLADENKSYPDSIDLDEVAVVARFPHNEVIPVQRLSGEQLQKLNSLSVADALRYFSGIQVKDYGGVGGIKTINVRSMGTNHVGVVYDGVQLGNAQNGQIDLGQFSLDNMEEISLYNGQKSDILQPAKDFGSAASVYLRTRSPIFEKGERFHARATVKAGSFDLFNPSALIEAKLSSKLRTAIGGEWLTSSGKYKFRYRRVTPSGDVAYDTTAVRQNGDINAFRIEANLFGDIKDGEWSAKVYHYESERGIPGAIVNNVWRRGERLWDNNTFAQAACNINREKFSTLNNLKYAYYHTHYINNDERVQLVDNTYRQQEAYLSTANLWHPIKWLKLSASYDLQWNSMRANLYNFVNPDRFTNLFAVASSFNFNRIKIQASGLLTLVHDHLQNAESPDDKHAFTPAVFLSAYPLSSREFSIRAFTKRSFRMPTFNDLYYTDIGNAQLNPERVSQYDLGLLFDRASRFGTIRALRFQGDVYYNKVHDKIVAYPKGQQFRWTMLNLGLVDIRGCDISALTSVNPIDELALTLRLQYTYQRAIDITNPADRYYGDQIPYIPRHSGSAVFNADWRGWNLNYSFIYVGGRYNQQENILYNYVQPWYTSDVSIMRSFRFGKFNAKAQIEINNIFSQDYEVITNYPMPERNYRFTITVEL